MVSDEGEVSRVRRLDGNGYRGVSSYSYKKFRFAVGFTVVSYRMPRLRRYGKKYRTRGIGGRECAGTRASSLNCKLVSGIASSRTRAFIRRLRSSYRPFVRVK